LVTSLPAKGGPATGICQGEINGDKTTDSVVVTSPTGANPPVVCGTLTGQHMYLETGVGTTGFAGSITFNYGTATATRTFRVKVTYFASDSNSALQAPAGCVQYFTGPMGTFQTYNFQGTTGNTMLDRQNYKTCFRQELGFCTVQFHESGTTAPDPFQLLAGPVIANMGATMTVTSLQGSVPNTCTGNFVQIDGIRYCGSFLNSITNQVNKGNVISRQSPFSVLTVSSFGIGATLAANAATALTGMLTSGVTGYSIDYTEVPC
jgi:hypothetical protein